MKSFFFFFFLGFYSLVNAQYSPLQVSGEIPEDFTISSTDKYGNDKSQINRKDGRRTKRYQKEFYLNSNFAIDDLLQSGYVLFNDPLTNYIDKIADHLLRGQPQFRQSLRFYTVRSTAVNAFATNQGIIFVNAGLIAQIENEAQLAYILAHEIAHVEKDHALKLYLESKEIDRTRSKELLRRTNFEDRMLAKNQFSRDQEFEADDLGLQLFLQSDYDPSAVDEAFQILDYAHLPVDNLPFDKSYFEDDYLIFPNRYHLAKVNPVGSLETEEEEEASTHPSIQKRRDKAQTTIGATAATTTKSQYLQSRSAFEKIQRLARYELLEYHLRDFAYVEAIYQAFLLQQQYSDDLYLKKIISKALYALSRLRNADEWEGKASEKYQGEIQRLAFLLEQLPDGHLNVLALRYAYLLQPEVTGQQVFQDILEELCQDLVNYHYPSLDSFLVEKMPVAIRDSALNSSNERWDAVYLKYALGDMVGESDFQQLFEKCKKNRRKKKVTIDKTITYRSEGKYALGKKKVVAVSPFYLVLKRNFKGPDLLKTEKTQSSFNNLLLKNAKLTGLKVELLDANNLSAKDADRFNDLRDINEWFSQQLLNDESLRLIPFNQERINLIAEKYRTDSFLWTGTLTSKKSGYSATGIYTFIFNPFAAAYHIGTSKGETIYFSLVLNAKTGETQMATFDYIKSANARDVMTQRVYETCWQIKRKKK